MISKIKKIITILILLLLVTPAYAGSSDSWKNWFCTDWKEGATETVRYAKQIGYEYVSISHIVSIANINWYKNNADCAGLYFYVLDPHNLEGISPAPIPSISGNLIRYFSYTQGTYDAYPQARKTFYESFAALRGTSTGFPTDIAPGYPSGPINSFVWDLQDQQIINHVKNGILSTVALYESSPGDAGHPFKFAGISFDTSGSSEFQGSQPISTWTGTDSTSLYGTRTRNFSTYFLGRVAFFDQLNDDMKAQFPNSKYIQNPSLIYHASFLEEFVRQYDAIDELYQITVPDQLIQENGPGYLLNFSTQTANFTGNTLGIDTTMVGSAQYSQGESRNREVSIECGKIGGYYNWFGLYSQGEDTFPSWMLIETMYPRIKMARVVPNWTHLVDGVFVQATVGGTTTGRGYLRERLIAYIGQKTIYARHWKRPNEIFVCFQEPSGTVLTGSLTVNARESVESIYATNGFCEPTGSDLKHTDFTLVYTGSGQCFVLPKDTIVGTSNGNLYIVNLKSVPVKLYDDGQVIISGDGVCNFN